MKKAKEEQKNCAQCGKPDSDSPRRRFDDGDLLGVCIACEKAHKEKYLAEIRARQAKEGKLWFSVEYSHEIYKIVRVWAVDDKDAARQAKQHVMRGDALPANFKTISIKEI